MFALRRRQERAESDPSSCACAADTWRPATGQTRRKGEVSRGTSWQGIGLNHHHRASYRPDLPDAFGRRPGTAARRRLACRRRACHRPTKPAHSCRSWGIEYGGHGPIIALRAVGRTETIRYLTRPDLAGALGRGMQPLVAGKRSRARFRISEQGITCHLISKPVNRICRPFCCWLFSIDRLIELGRPRHIVQRKCQQCLSDTGSRGRDGEFRKPVR